MRASNRDQIAGGAEAAPRRVPAFRGRAWLSFGAAILLVGTGTSCDTIVGGGTAESEVLVVAAVADGGAVPSESPFEGTIRVRLRAFLVGGTGFPISLSGGEREVEVDVGGEVSSSLGTYVLLPGLYQGLRVVLTEVSAELLTGLGDGSQGGSVTVNLGQEPLTIELGSSVLVRDEARLVVTVDLSAPDWLAAVATTPPPRIVTRDVFQSFVGLRVRVE